MAPSAGALPTERGTTRTKRAAAMSPPVQAWMGEPGATSELLGLLQASVAGQRPELPHRRTAAAGGCPLVMCGDGAGAGAGTGGGRWEGGAAGRAAAGGEQGGARQDKEQDRSRGGAAGWTVPGSVARSRSALW